jgi:hypothetical protein
MNRNVVNILFFCLFLPGCEVETDYTTTVKGHFREVRSGKPIIGAGFLLYHDPLFDQEEYIGYFGNFSDSTGFFEVTFVGEKGPSYYIQPDALGYYCSPNCSIYLNLGEVNVLDIELEPTALFTLNIANESPIMASDSIYFCLEGEYLLDNYEDCWYCLGDCNENVFRNYPFQSNQTINLTWWVTENGITTPYSDDIELVSLDTVEYTIRY